MKKRSKLEIIGILVPLLMVGTVATAISYATLIDVARINGIPLPELYPLLIDFGTLACIVVSQQMRQHAMKGGWLATVAFVGLSALSVYANGTHAMQNADFTVTSVVLAVIMAATPPLTLMAVTHLFIMLIPNQKELARLAKESEQAKHKQAQQPAKHIDVESSATSKAASKPQPQSVADGVAELNAGEGLNLVENAPDTTSVISEVEDWVRAYITEHNARPSGRVVGEMLGKSPKTGERLTARIFAETSTTELAA